MSIITTKESVPGFKEAKAVEYGIRAAGIEDIKIFYDKDIKPNGMWCVCQVKKATSQFLLPGSYNEGNIQPMILWWCKDNEGRFRVPNQNDVHDAVVVAVNAQKTWDKGGDALDDQFIKQDEAKQEAHEKTRKDRIHAVAPALQRAIKRELS